MPRKPTRRIGAIQVTSKPHWRSPRFRGVMREAQSRSRGTTLGATVRRDGSVSTKRRARWTPEYAAWIAARQAQG